MNQSVRWNPGDVLGSEAMGARETKVRCGVNVMCVFEWS